MHAVTVTMMLDVDCDNAASDAVNEILRERQRSFVSSSSLMDYAICNGPIDAGPLPENYIEGAYFGTANTGASQGVGGFPSQEVIVGATAAPLPESDWSLDDILAKRAPLDTPAKIAERLSERQRAVLLKLNAEPKSWYTASKLKSSGSTLMSLNDFERGQRDILPPLVLVTWVRSEPTGGREWSITEFGRQVATLVLTNQRKADEA